ncbi:DHHC palmitoyltransferase-domain-containing protein [Hyaloraphidium curvatum]|nr:DHHC palmitoyltransferase-domain-containing protein [Hyaloraphidium curvatum]
MEQAPTGPVHVYRGQNRVCRVFGVQVVTGRDKDAFTLVGALVLILAPSIVFYIFVCPPLWARGYYPVPIIYGYLVLQTLVELLRTTGTDPGIIPRDLDPSPPTIGNAQVAQPSAYRGAHAPEATIVQIPDGHAAGAVSTSSAPNGQSNGTAPPPPPREPLVGEVTVVEDARPTSTLPPNYPFVTTTGGMAVHRDVLVMGKDHMKRKWCETCHTYRPLRASHCSLCDSCIDAHDHHCPWTANCIGRRNYRHFFFFVVGCCGLAVYNITFSAVHLAIVTDEQNDFLKALAAAPASMALIVFCFFIGMSLCGLAFMHVSQIANGFTTHESLRSAFNGIKKSRFDRGLNENFRWMLFRPVWPTMIDWNTAKIERK